MLASRFSASFAPAVKNVFFPAFVSSKRRSFVAASSSSPLKTLGVVGAGQMGTGIAIVAAQVANMDVVLVDVSDEQLSKSTAFVKDYAKKNVDKGKITAQDAAELLSRIRTFNSVNNLKSADFVVEAATENLDLKCKIFKQISDVVSQDIVLATNTSSISITKVAQATKNPSNFIGMHFMNPVPVMKLVEVITGLKTSQTTLDTTLKLAAQMGKTTTSSKDYPGFIANRILMPYINEAIYTLMEGVATKEDIDATMKLGTNVPMGPLTLADFIGLDTCLAIMQVLHNGLGDSKYRPCPLLVQYVDAGLHGKKSGQGFYDYRVAAKK